jgi:uncharacterized protein YdaU (DUF1376 family)
MNFYSFHVGDYKRRTAHLTPIEDIVYRRLLDQYYMDEKCLIDDPENLARLIVMRDHIDVVCAILKEFFVLTENGWWNKTCDEEIAKYKSRAERASKLADKRWHGNPTEKPCDVVSATHTTSIANQEPEPDISKPISKKVADAPVVVIPEALATDAFRANWDAYLAYRKEMRFKSLKAQSQITLLNEMAAWGEKTAIEAINTSIRNGWQGVFEPRTQRNAVPASTNKPSKYANAW